MSVSGQMPRMPKWQRTQVGDWHSHRGKTREERLYYQVLWESKLHSVEGFREPEQTCTSDFECDKEMWDKEMWDLGHFTYHLLTAIS